jgi:trehalose/maltose hydrolase-like predicted phosphorylase
VTHWQPDYLPAYLSNGLIGLRVGHLPLRYGVAMLTGFEGLDPETRVPAFARMPYPLAGEVRIGRTTLSDPDRAQLCEQRYDFSCGELTTRMRFEAEDARADLETVTLCSRTQPSLVLQETTLVVDADCEVTMSACIDAQDVPGDWAHDQPDILDARPEWADGPFAWRSMGAMGTAGIAVANELIGAERYECHSGRHAPHRLLASFTFDARQGHRYLLRQLVSMVPQNLHAQPHMQAARLVKAGQLRGFEELRRDNKASWDRLWRGRVQLVGAPTRWQALADAAYFYLHTSVHGSSPAATSVFGLAYWPNYHYYRGHMMWDTETFAIPPLLLTHPDAAAGMLRYRADRLPAARANARLTGYRGAQYPWESSLQQGVEATPAHSLGPATEHHIPMDVAIALARYVHATGDTDFGQIVAWPVMAAVSEWIESRVERTARGYEIHGVQGIAETSHLVNNSAFVNMTAITALRETVAMSEALRMPHQECWQTIADELVMPVDTEMGVIGNHDGYRSDEMQSSTPDAAAALFPLDFQVEPELERKTLDFYLRLADRYAGQPMLSSMLGVYAARLGDRDRSLAMFEWGYGDFVVEPFTITTEYSPNYFPDHPKAGPFTANLGGFLTGCLYGLPGLRLNGDDPHTWFERPVVLPARWDAIHVDRVWVRGQAMTLDAVHGEERARFGPADPG